MSNYIFLPNHTAVITGASSGIGRAAVDFCVSKGMHVWMIDNDESELVVAREQVIQHLHQINQQSGESNKNQQQVIQSIVADVSIQQQMIDVATQIFNHISTTSVHFLMNNAAIQIGGKALSTTMDTFQHVFSVNTLGPIHGCLAFIPTMKERGYDGLIVSTGSKQGITMPPGNLTYNVSKAALKTWMEGLEHELMKERCDSNIKGKLRAALLIPGWTNTSILRKELRTRAALEGNSSSSSSSSFNEESVFFHEGKPAPGAWMPNQVIEFMVQELDKGRFYIVCPDNDVDRETDNIRMTWTMQDITEDRPPLSRWHPDWSQKFTDYLNESRKEK